MREREAGGKAVTLRELHSCSPMELEARFQDERGRPAALKSCQRGKSERCWHKSRGALHGTLWKLDDTRNKLEAWPVAGCMASYVKETCLTVFSSVYVDLIGLPRT